MRPRPTPSNQQRQSTPSNLVARLLDTVHHQFCSDLTAKQWAQHSHFIRRNVIMWPARFMMGKGFTVPAARYESILREIFQDIKRCGKTEAVKYWPGYLMKCVQDHWLHHWEEYYAESKSVYNMAAAALLACQAAPVAVDRTVETIALAHRVLTEKRRASKPSPDRKQLSLL